VIEGKFGINVSTGGLFVHGEGLVYLETGHPYGIGLCQPRWNRWAKEKPGLSMTLESGYMPAAGAASKKISPEEGPKKVPIEELPPAIPFSLSPMEKNQRFKMGSRRNQVKPARL
jgi:hypothetical protein